MNGLTTAQAEESRRIHGANILTPPEKESVWMQLLEKFRDPLIIILMVAGLLSVGISCYEYLGLHHSRSVFIEPAGIFAAIFLATGLGFIFEYRAEKEFAVLNKISDDDPVQVVRNGKLTSLPRRDVVVGDIIHINTGEEIPADARLLQSTRLSVDESTLTGEPICHKSADPSQRDPEATFPTDEVLRGTKVAEGHGVAVVEAVGDATEAGKVFTAARIDNSVKTPLNEQLDRLSRLISIASYIIGALVIVGRVTIYLSSHGSITDWIDFSTFLLQSLMLAVTLVVCSVPEGLPMAVTLSLAYSMRRMLRSANLVRKMHACETMGAVTVICTDKTGTLTANRMQVSELQFLSDITPEQAAIDMALNSTANLDDSNTGRPVTILGNPTEGALLLWMAEKGIDYRRLRDSYKRVDELPFSTERKLMATVIESDSGRRLVVKGAPEIVYSLCNHDDEKFDRSDLQHMLSSYQGQAMRTLGFASMPLAPGQDPIDGDKLTAPDLRFDMVAAISDPVREDVPPAIREALGAGIKIKIVTGDTPATATEIARRIGLWTASDSDKNITTGEAIAKMSDEDLRRHCSDWKIIARARPMDKRRLVEALQANGEVVAVTGDGTNDAPALKAAHVGLSMGDGTAVAKEASDITILNNSFSGITNAVVWGRSLYRNIQRFILFQLTVNIAACLTVMIGSFMGSQSPLTVTQMLWVNLIMDTFAAMALASLPPSRSVLKERPRKRTAFIITPPMARNILFTGTIFAIVLLALLFTLEHATITRISDFCHITLQPEKLLSPYELALFFTFFIMLQLWNIFNARAFGSHRSAFHLAHCSEFIAIVITILIGQILIVTFFGQAFSITRISLIDWLVIILITSPVLLIGELMRLTYKESKTLR
ncbi:MAG: calcium-translocating P-type ATPase, PMCA-type [Bacteroides sp.]|nr:calcium-translocating P-type ATPase, PMCA-type [Bacteroides sp.]MCM1471851.1 calcium-translocating P-type ATPase, PMCA-type [Bacteroides sp.]